jgi:hypothetical protein
MKPVGCPVCGYPQVDVLDEQGCTTFEICDSCGAESGYTFDAKAAEERLCALRKEWLNVRGAKWWSTTTSPPTGWDPLAQLQAAGLEVPDR